MTETDERPVDRAAVRRTQAEHCLKRAAETLEGSPPSNREIDRTYDLAVSARALLALYRTFHPRDDHSGSDTGIPQPERSTTLTEIS
ncbi:MULTISPECIES: hypothetical protein [Streptomyces]|uniref:hypothetical protein n=1 Tax=Streptomyces TaxID=1883 RepID=UPI0033C85A5D